jgi:orotidine-5'-phosphate decarboxylase
LSNSVVTNLSKGSERLIYALDVPDAATALKWVKRLGNSVGMYKVGLELFVASGPDLVREIVGQGSKVFLDLKFHDIPNTVAGAVRSAATMGASIVNLHALAGGEAMKLAAKASKEAAAKAGVEPPKLIAVTILTSHSQATLDELGLGGTPAEAVKRLAMLARDSGMDGVVCSPEEASAIREIWSEGLIVTPGIRPAGSAVGDQVRIATPKGAINAGADYLVVGRPIREADDPVAAANSISKEIEEALNP